MGLSATAESEQESEWRPRRASEWICEDIRPTDVRISMGPTADNEVACGTCGGYHFLHPCPLAALVRAQGESCHLRQAQLFPEEEEEEGEEESGRVDKPHTVSAAAALLQLQVFRRSELIYCAAVPLTTPIRCAPAAAPPADTELPPADTELPPADTELPPADALRPLVAPWVLVALGEAADALDAATTRAALLRMRRQLSQLVAPATSLFEATRGLRPVNGEGYMMEEDCMQDHLPVPRVGGTLNASLALIAVLDGMANGKHHPQLLRPPAAWGVCSQGSVPAGRSGHDDVATGAGGTAGAGAGELGSAAVAESPDSLKNSEYVTTAAPTEDVTRTHDDDIWAAPDVTLHWWDQDAECGWSDDYVGVCRVDVFKEMCLAPGTTLPPHERDSTRCCALGFAGGTESTWRYMLQNGEVL